MLLEFFVPYLTNALSFYGYDSVAILELGKPHLVTGIPSADGL